MYDDYGLESVAWGHCSWCLAYRVCYFGFQGCYLGPRSCCLGPVRGYAQIRSNSVRSLRSLLSASRLLAIVLYIERADAHAAAPGVEDLRLEV